MAQYKFKIEFAGKMQGSLIFGIYALGTNTWLVHMFLITVLFIYLFSRLIF